MALSQPSRSTAACVPAHCGRWAALSNAEVLNELESHPDGVYDNTVPARLTKHGRNTFKTSGEYSVIRHLRESFCNPFNILLSGLAILSYTVGGDSIGGSIILAMVALSVTTTMIQEYKSTHAVEKLRALVSNKCTVLRRTRKLDLFIEDSDSNNQSAPDRSHPPASYRRSQPAPPVLQTTANATFKALDDASSHQVSEADSIDLFEVPSPHSVGQLRHDDVKEEDHYESRRHEISVQEVVPGDIVLLCAGDMLPADCRLIVSKDLFIDQSLLTGESLPVEKQAVIASNRDAPTNVLEHPALCLTGTSVVSGTARAVVLETGARTVFGSLAKSLGDVSEVTAFDKGVNQYVYLMLRFMAFIVSGVFVVNGAMKHDWFNAFLFAIAVAIGLTPQMLPMVITVNLAKGAYGMARRKAIVKKLKSIQNLGAMDVLCTDKTGTLTTGKVALQRYVNSLGQDDDAVLEYAFLNSHFQSGLKNMIDDAIVSRAHSALGLGNLLSTIEKVDEVPFDFKRRRMSVFLRRSQSESKQDHLLVCKGAVDETLSVCSTVRENGVDLELTAERLLSAQQLANHLTQQGFRILAVAIRAFPLQLQHAPTYSVADEMQMTLVGLVALWDPARDTAQQAIEVLALKGISTKVLTGDSDLVTKLVCAQVGVHSDRIVLGSDIDKLDGDSGALSQLCETNSVFAKLTPANKARIVQTLRQNGHVVGFLGDGINDTPALKAADVGISVDNAVDIAKETADIILLEKSLLVLDVGVSKGRKVFGNIIKYIKMGASSSFGNMFSVLGASIMFPFLPMQPVQLLLQNLLYDFSQIAMPFDSVDSEFVANPRKWSMRSIARFMIIMGPISSIFDYTTWCLMWWYYGVNASGASDDNDPAAVLFQSAWFVEGLVTQTLIVHVIRSRKVPFLQTMAAWPLVLSTALVIIAGLVAPLSPIAPYIPFVALPGSFYGFLLATNVAYCALAHIGKMAYYRYFDDE